MADLSLFSGMRILIVGLGREGVALARFLAKHGLPITATDRQPAEKFGRDLESLAAAGVTLVLGEHPDTLLDHTDLLFVSPGVPLEIPFLAQARARNLPLSTESRLFCHLCPAPIVGISGSSGKTTTTTLVGKILEADHRTTWVGGNIGRPLIDVVDNIQPTDRVVMELSSFQLEYFHARLNQSVDRAALPEPVAVLLDDWSPPIAALLNITPNHLDRHPTMKHYVQAKRALIDYQQPDDVVVLGLDNDLTRTIGYQLGERVRWFSLEAQLPHGAGLTGNTLALFDAAGRPQPVVPQADVKLRGPHNLRNILAAALLSDAAGAASEAMQQVFTTFAGVDHRLQPVRQLNGVTYINDSISTSPERLIAALRSFSEPIVLLAGGRDKRLPWDEAARLILSSVRELILFGEAAGLIEAAIERVRPEIRRPDMALHHCDTLAEAVQRAAGVAQPGCVVLLSPGCASYDAYSSYVERGDQFKSLVLAL